MMPVATTTKTGRTASREMRRQQLIDATIKCISRKGIGGTTLADVASMAGLSQGIVNLHFTSKENLLNETLRYLSQEYRSRFEAVLENSPPAPAEKLLALMEMDLGPAICDRKKLAVWFAFWGEVKAVPTYQKICAAHDRAYSVKLHELCQQIIDEGNYADLSATTVADALSAMTDGLWLSCLIGARSFDREAALDAVYSYLRSVFPEHYE
ncbi:MAG: TetR family transcriptional regulator C-terminal domain-containing protein [Woeseiaceae bacterium]|nr:TetR family transcriptional regulator C-terminal domain-containing protein [Woeseiaceae bacterium]